VEDATVLGWGYGRQISKSSAETSGAETDEKQRGQAAKRAGHSRETGQQYSEAGQVIFSESTRRRRFRDYSNYSVGTATAKQ
jgi:hypothetical protein